MSMVFVPILLQMSDSQKEFPLLFVKDVRIKTNVRYMKRHTLRQMC